MSYHYHLVHEDNKVLIDVGNNIYSFQEATDTYNKLLSMIDDVGTSQMFNISIEKPCNKLTPNDWSIVFGVYGDTVKLLSFIECGCSMRAISYVVENEIPYNDDSLYLGDNKIHKYNGWTII